MHIGGHLMKYVAGGPSGWKATGMPDAHSGVRQLISPAGT